MTRGWMARAGVMLGTMAEALRRDLDWMGAGVDGAIGRLSHSLSLEGRAGHAIAPVPDTDLSAADRAITDQAEATLRAGVELMRWWEEVDAAGAYGQRFPIVRKFNRSSDCFGFYGGATLGGRPTSVMGEVEDMPFDDPKEGPPERFQQEVREFALRYLMRVSDFRKPAPYLPPDRRTPRRVLGAASLCPTDRVQREGFGFAQLYYKRRATGEIGKFPEKDRHRIVDLRELGDTYEWIVVKVRIFDFTMSVSPAEKLRIVVPLEESSHLVLSRDFVVDETGAWERDPGVRGRYGFGYAFLRDPEQEFLAYGPGSFDVAFQLIHFHVRADGRTEARLVFVANRPSRITNLNLAPLDWGLGIAEVASLGLLAPLLAPARRVTSRIRFGSLDPVLSGVRLANAVTGGWAGRALCISREQLEKTFLVKHFDQHYEMMTGALRTWRVVPDWLATEALPDWVRTGESR